MNTISKDAYEGDLVSRLRNWRGLHLAHGGKLFEEAADEIERLRSLVRFQDGVIRSGDVACLTEAERRAIELAMQGGTPASDEVESQMVETLRGLLDRLGSE